MKVCILAAGIGSQSDTVSETMGKALLPIGNTTVLSKIINKFPKDYEFIIAVGHKSDLIKAYCKSVHDDISISFIDIQDYDSLESGPATSLLQCRDALGSDSFYLITSDCLFDENLPVYDHDWIGVCKTNNKNLFATVKFDKNFNLIDIKNKIKDGYDHAFIGIAFIKSASIFWDLLNKNIFNYKIPEFISAWLNPSIYEHLKCVELTWNDTGTIANYTKTLNKYGQPNLGMSKIITEHTFLENKTIVKIVDNKTKNNNRIKRALDLKDLVPNLKHYSESANLISYKWVDGQEMYFGNNFIYFQNLLSLLYDKLWKHKTCPNFDKLCYSFYHDKTFQRFDKINFIDDNYCNINDLFCEPVGKLLSRIDFHSLSEGNPVLFHGDLQFQNIICNNGNFTLIDWREDFSGNTECGDLFYDLAKLNACLYFDYSKINSISSSLKIYDNSFIFSETNNENLKSCISQLKEFILSKNIDKNCDKVELLTALIWLNMSPLHTYPDNIILFLQSKYFLNKIKNSNSYFRID